MTVRLTKKPPEGYVRLHVDTQYGNAWYFDHAGGTRVMLGSAEHVASVWWPSGICTRELIVPVAAARRDVDRGTFGVEYAWRGIKCCIEISELHVRLQDLPLDKPKPAAAYEGTFGR